MSGRYRVGLCVWGALCALLRLAGSEPAEAGLGVWTQGQPSIAPNIFRAVVVDPAAPATLYAATNHIPTAGSPGRQVFKSTDGGSSWAEKPVAASRAISPLALDPLAPGTVYAGATFQTGFAAEVFKSTDGGDSWTSMSSGLPDAGARVSILALAVHPHIPGTVFASTGIGLFKSTDGAASWAPLTTGLVPPPVSNTPSVAIVAIVIDPSAPLVLYAGVGAGALDPGGVLKSADGGVTWTPINNGLTGQRDVRALVIDPRAPNTLYAGTFGTGAFKTTDGGQSWTPLNAGETDVLALAIDPQAPANLYAGVGGAVGGMVRSTNGGATWGAFNPGLPSGGTFSVAISPSGACLHSTTAGGLWHLTTRPDACDLSAPPVPQTTLVAAVLPSSRSVMVGTTATVFATIINSGANPALQVGTSLGTLLPGPPGFKYNRTDCSTNVVIGSDNAPVDIPAGGSACYVLSITPTAAFGSTDIQFDYAGTNTAPVTVLVGINTLLMSASLTPVPDVIVQAATIDCPGPPNQIPGCPFPSTPGVLDIPEPGAFALASTNCGAPATITVTADTGSASLAVAIAICSTGVFPCTTPSVTLFIDHQDCVSPGAPLNPLAQPTFSVFVQGTGGPIAFDPAANRIFVRFRDQLGVIRGGTSVAVRTR